MNGKQQRNQRKKNYLGPAADHRENLWFGDEMNESSLAKTRFLKAESVLLPDPSCDS